uniref:Uncharacterized protein n=1 Tax=Trichobilharzia regenti TaxID=157069 RepID=A0AA85J915_TRIRE|nr:unnamed protein product [Trichobilharzia regenti]
MHCIEFKKEEEVVSRASQMLQYCNGDSKSLSSTNELMLSLGNIYERNKNTNQQLLLEPLRKICSILSPINDIFQEREDIVKEINRKYRKIRRFEPVEHIGEMSTKYRKISQTVDSLTSRLQITETAISANLMDLTSILEVFLSSSFHVHVSCTSDFFMKASAVSQQISKALYTEPGELPVLDKKIHEEMNSLYKLLHLKPEK